MLTAHTAPERPTAAWRLKKGTGTTTVLSPPQKISYLLVDGGEERVHIANVRREQPAICQWRRWSRVRAPRPTHSP